MDDLVIDFSDDGSVEAMHVESFDLGFLGFKSIRRATEIVFDELTQQWYLSLCIYDDEGKMTAHPIPEFQWPSYEVARNAEIIWLNTCRASAVNPASEEGKAILKASYYHA